MTNIKTNIDLFKILKNHFKESTNIHVNYSFKNIFNVMYTKKG